jgi:hypothetical protein
MDVETFVLDIEDGDTPDFQDGQILQKVKSANTIYARFYKQDLTLDLWIKINAVGIALNAKNVNLEAFDILEFPKDHIKFCVFSEVNLMNSTNTLTFVKYLSDAKYLNNSGLTSLGFYSYFGGEKTNTLEFKTSLIPEIIKFTNLTNLIFEYRADNPDTRYSNGYMAVNSILNRTVLRNLISLREARNTIMVFLLGNRCDRDSYCVIFPKNIASMIAKYTFRLKDEWIPDDSFSKIGMSKIMSKHKEYNKLTSEKECLDIRFHDPSELSKSFKVLTEYQKSKTRVKKLVIECDNDKDNNKITYIYSVFSFCIRSECTKLTFNNINFDKLGNYGGMNPGQTHEQMPAEEDLIPYDIEDSRYRLWKLEDIQIVNCYEVYHVIKLILKILENKAKFTLRYLKLKDFMYLSKEEIYKKRFNEIECPPVMDSVQIRINYTTNYIDITRL